MADIEKIMQAEMDLAVTKKSACKVDEEDAFAMRVSIVGPDGRVMEVPHMQWRSNKEKRLKMLILSALCQKVSATAALVMTDARYLVPEEFCKHFNLPFPQTENFWDDYTRIMADYNYEMGRLPRNLWEESLIVVAYGPRIAKMMMTRYTVVDRAYVFEPSVMMPESGETHVDMIPAWWH